MAVDNLKLQFHLTPRGWIAGTRWFFGKVQDEERPRPADAIATYELHITQQSAFSSEHRSWGSIWQKKDSDVQALLDRFPRPDEDSDLPKA